MLKRIVTAIVLIPLVLLIIGEGSPRLLDLCAAVIVLLGVWEWSNLLRLKHAISRFVYLLLFILGAYFIHHLHPETILYISLGWWVIATVFVKVYPAGAVVFEAPAILGFLGFIVLLPWWYGIHVLRLNDIGISAIFFILVLVWAADTGAYFAGKAWGNRKLVPKLSPGKTVVGFVAGLLSPVLVMFLASLWLPWVASHRLSMVALALAVAFISIIGDLFESLLKRNRGIKDSGVFIPGHGGVLDRIDSLTAAIPLFVLGLHWIGIY